MLDPDFPDEPVTNDEVLEKLNDLELQFWNFKDKIFGLLGAMTLILLILLFRTLK